MLKYTFLCMLYYIATMKSKGTNINGQKRKTDGQKHMIKHNKPWQSTQAETQQKSQKKQPAFVQSNALVIAEEAVLLRSTSSTARGSR